MIGRSTHLTDDRLFECYGAARGGETADPRWAEHLAECPGCNQRYADLSDFMEGLRDEADVETDELFPAERLLAQQQQILRRLAHVDRPARVIAFPPRVAATVVPDGSRVPPRWLAAAAAAGLFIGIAVGGLFGPAGLRRSAPPMRVASAPTVAEPRSVPAPAALVSTPAATPDDDAFMLALELALAQPTLRDLQPFDALTPQVREISARAR